MAYRLKLNEPLDKGFRRIATEQIELALHELGSGGDRVVAVHETRKAMKRIRALLKLIRPALSEDDYKRENQRFAGIARLLAGTRDDDVLKQTASRMAAGAGDAAQKLAAGIVAADGGDRAPHVAEAITALVEARDALAKIPVRKSFSSVRRGLERSYRAGRRAMIAAYEDGEDETFHEWRKAVQAHWRHMALLSRCWPEAIEARASLSREAAELLGEDHDLYVLIQAAGAKAGDGETGAGAGELIDAARQRQRQIRRELAPKGQLLFAEGAAEFAGRVARYWTAAKLARRLTKKTGKDDGGNGGPESAARSTGGSDASAPAKSGAAGGAKPRATRPKAGTQTRKGGRTSAAAGDRAAAVTRSKGSARKNAPKT